MIKQTKVFLFIFFFSFSCAFSQNEWDQLKFQRFGAEQGLTVTTTFSIVQDDHGFLWIATIDGLQRYDGYSFVHYKNNFNDSTSLADNTVSMLAKGKGNVLWVGTFSGGLNCLDISTGKFKRFQNIPQNNNSLSSNRVWSVLEDKKGIVWVGTDHGLNRIDPVSKKITRYLHEEYNQKSICGNNILCIEQDNKGMLWIGTTNGLSIATLDEEGNITQFNNFKNVSDNPESISNNIIMSLYESKDGQMWIGTSDGFNTLKNGEWKFKTIRFTPKADSVSKQVYSYLNSYGANAIRAVYEDEFKNLWLCTDKGLKILDPKTEKFLEYHFDPNDPSTLSTDLLYGFCEDRSGNLWIGTMVGGLNKTDLKPKKFELSQTQNGNPFNLSKNNIRSIYVDSKNILWIGTMEGGLNRMNNTTGKFEQFKNNDFTAGNIWCIKEDRKGILWFGSSAGLFSYNRTNEEFKQYKTDKNDPVSISDNIVRSIFEDSKGTLWIGTEGGLNKFNRDNQSFQRFLHSEKNKNSLSNNTVWTIQETKDTLWIGTDNGLNKLIYAPDHSYSFEHFFPEEGNKNSLSNRSIRSIWIESDGIFWIGTSNGLNKFDPKTRSFTRFNEENGLANSYIYGVLGDADRTLWISTNNGISRFNIASGTFRNYDKLDGLQNNEFNTGAYHKSKNGRLFFGGPDGFNSFYPDSLFENKIPPPVVITSIKIFGAELANEKQSYEISEITLKYNQNVISFEFAALDFTVPEKNAYRYMLEGFDKDWIMAGSRRFVNYTNLDPGNYQFKIRASNNDGIWNDEGVTIHLTIVPPFWKTWWFQTSVFVFVVLSVFGYVKRRINLLRKNELLLEKQVLLKTKELRDEKEIVEIQNKVIEKKNHSITSSIHYAKRIQESILPIKEKLNELIPESFIFFKPKDIVSGDFYWFSKLENKILVAAVDCTGHGVPGAFMSLIGNNLLNDIVKNQKIADPAVILQKVHEGLIVALKKGEQESGTVDGMDITLCVLDLEKNILEFSSTGRPLIHIRENILKKHKVGRHPLGLITKKEITLEKEHIQLKENDTFYIFTDGYCDQFGGEEDDKYLDANFEKLLLKIQHQTMAQQAISIEAEINAWKGDSPQIDDMLVIGVRC